ncbi:hypothetical protein WHZ95_27475 [Escherichia coli]|uniref:hypothetical protein n=1 Tax=Enterobacteriaceae TaxID=543 RepID=UPI00339CC29A
MFDQITDGVHFVTALILSVIIWGLCLAVAWYFHFSEARRYSWHNNSLADFMDLIPNWLMNTVLVAWFIVGTFPMLNYVADKAQFGGVVGRARELNMFDDRPWYGVGGYQFLIVVVILIVGYLINWYRNK